MRHVGGWYTIHHLLRHHGAKGGHKLVKHFLPVSKLSTELSDLLLHVRINGGPIACSLREGCHAVLRLRDHTEQIIPPLVELGRRHHSLLNIRLLVPRYHTLIGTRWTDGLCGGMGGTMHLILRRLHGCRSKHLHGGWLIRRMLGTKTWLLETSDFLLTEHFQLAGNAGIVHRCLHHRVHVERCLHLLLGIHGHVREIGRHEGLRLIGLRIVENWARGIHTLRVKAEGLLDLLNNGLTLAMRESLPSSEFLHLNKENVSIDVITRKAILRKT